MSQSSSKVRNVIAIETTGVCRGTARAEGMFLTRVDSFTQHYPGSISGGGEGCLKLRCYWKFKRTIVNDFHVCNTNSPAFEDFEPLVCFSVYKIGEVVPTASFSGRWQSQLILIAWQLQNAFCEFTMLLFMEIIDNNYEVLFNTLTLN